MSAIPTILQGSDVALRRQVSKRIINVAFRKPTFLGLLASLDTFYNKQGNLRIDPLGIEGGAMQINYWTSLPVWQGADAENPDYDARRIPLVRNAELIAGTVNPSAYEFAEPIDMWKVNRFKDDKQAANYVSQLADRAAEGLIVKLDADMFPSVNQTTGGTGYGPGVINHISSVAYFLQSGYATNALTGTGTYPLYGIDLNARPNMKAVNSGTDGSPFVLSASNLRSKLIMPIRDRGGNPDVILCGAAAYNYIVELAEAKRRDTSTDKTLKFGGSYVWFEGCWVVYESALDRLPVPEIYVLDSSTWRFGMMKDGLQTCDLLEKLPQLPSAMGYQGYTEFALVCENPRFNGRGYNVSIPG